jgi:hypothetical protein
LHIAICLGGLVLELAGHSRMGATRLREYQMKGLALYAAFVIFCTIGAVLIGQSVGTYTSADISSIVMLVLFFAGLIVSWIATCL